MTPEISELDAIAAIIRVAYEEQLPTINGDSCFERIAAERVLAHTSERSDVAGWCGYHSEKGFDRNTFALTRQEAVSRLMMTGIAGDHGWKVEPLYRHHVSGSTEGGNG